MSSGAEKIVVPLKYNKEYSFKTSFSGDKKFTLSKQSFLSIYKDGSGNFHADVITIYPDESFLNNMNPKFQGLLTIDDWNENRIKTYLYKDGKLYSVEEPHFYSDNQRNQAVGRTNEICMTVYWYWCEGWETNLSQCSYIGYTTYENCADYQSLEPPGEGGDYVNEIVLSRPWKWGITYTGDWYAESYETVTGVKNTNESQGGHFTGISHVSSYFTVTAGYTWEELGNTVSIDNPQKVYSSTTGKAIASNGGFTVYSRPTDNRFDILFP
jgi:hypothetical protein